ncbi:protein SHORT HYPOCOTYL IN WHITE LIGHT 1-like [Zingiber officinale]|uniref:protein SHORT HYPOCOTYL IN WHITE LIGHT 1-like n=1 Tax=Zingiber officinale TaxID=94328 RepID=UPI001C4BDE10|nr:protein SHORT HYPOCOTYL IN WHITE LIGHT 1-like [Zingiber officinale]
MASCSVSASVSFSASRCRRLYFSDRYRLRYLLLGSLSLPSPNRPLSATPHASKRFSSYGQETVEVVPNPRAWDGNLGGLGYEEDDDEEDDEDEDDRSLDLLVRFLNSVFRKISRRARRAVRAVLPPAIPTKLVGFSVNGVLILATLWILKAFLEVICTFGSMVFVSILLVRGIWSGITYIRMNQYTYTNRMDNEDSQWSGIQAA